MVSYEVTTLDSTSTNNVVVLFFAVVSIRANADAIA
jgi:hypothetical protein